MQKIESTQNPLVKHLVKLRTDRAYRYEQKRVCVEGRNLVKELKKPLRLFVVEEKNALPAEETYLVAPEVMEKISGVKTPEGIVAEVAMPENNPLEGKRLLVLDGVSDPGNMGTLLRTALALGWEGVFIVEGSTDPYNDKALRAAKGATFRIPLFQGTWDELPPLPRFVADIQGTPLEEIGEQKGMMLILSNEAKGVSKRGKEGATAVTIPMSNMESLNVAAAGAILMYSLKGKNV